MGYLCDIAICDLFYFKGQVGINTFAIAQKSHTMVAELSSSM
jgi:hypothetical protein